MHQTHAVSVEAVVDDSEILSHPPVKAVGVGWRRRRRTRLSLHEIHTVDNQGTFSFSFSFFHFLVWRSSRLAVKLDHFCAGVEGLNSAQGECCLWNGGHTQP